MLSRSERIQRFFDMRAPAAGAFARFPGPPPVSELEAATGAPRRSDQKPDLLAQALEVVLDLLLRKPDFTRKRTDGDRTVAQALDELLPDS